MLPRNRLRDRRAERSLNNEGGQQDPMRVFANMWAETMRAGTPIVGNRSESHLTNFKDFKMAGPPEFIGTTDPIEAQVWIEEMEKVFEVASVAEEQKTVLATFMMKGEANYWWKATQSRAGEGIITWTRFKELFFENYFPDSLKSRMEIKFLELKQGDMTVLEYAAKFNELSRFAPHQVDTEARKAKRFEQGLKPELYSKISVFQVHSFAKILEKSIIAEGGSEIVTSYKQEQKRKRSDMSSNMGSGGGNKLDKRKRISNNQSSGSKRWDSQREEKKCGKCRRKHSGKCLKGTNICFQCGQKGHILPNCPNTKKKMGCFVCGSADHQVKNCSKRGW